MRPDELTVRAATSDDARFICTLRSHPGTSEFLAVSDQTEADLRAELGEAAQAGGRMIAERAGHPLAALRWTVINRRSRIAELSEVIVEPRARGQGIAAMLVRTAAQRLFDQHDMHRVELEVYGDNQSAQRAFEHAGFLSEGRRRRAYWRRGTWQDGMIYALLADEL